MSVQIHVSNLHRTAGRCELWTNTVEVKGPMRVEFLIERERGIKMHLEVRGWDEKTHHAHVWVARQEH